MYFAVTFRSTSLEVPEDMVFIKARIVGPYVILSGWRMVHRSWVRAKLRYVRPPGCRTGK